MLDATTGSPRGSRLYDSLSQGTSQVCCSEAILLCFQSDEHFADLSGPLHWCHPDPSRTAGWSVSKNTTIQIQVATGTLVATSSDNAAHRSILLHLIPTHRNLTMNQFDKDEAAAVKAITMLIKHEAEHDFAGHLDCENINISNAGRNVGGWDGTLLITNISMERQWHGIDRVDTLDIEAGGKLDTQFSDVAFAFKCQATLLEVCGHLAVKVSHA
jgi:hypothetical protein